MSGLPLIGADQILGENLLCQRRANLFHALLGEEPLAGLGGIGDKVDVGMVALVVKGCVPFQVVGRYLQPLGQLPV